MEDLGEEGKGARRAAVLGSGVAGLLAAHVLARRGERVVVFERDADPAWGEAIGKGIVGPRPAKVGRGGKRTRNRGSSSPGG